ncbi:MAG: alpha/beta hydrolase [Planctomycetota bacterium]
MFPLIRKKVLFLPGWFSDGGTKAAFMRSLGYDVRTPRLSDWFFRRAVVQAQRAFEDMKPDVIVGASRGGGVAMDLDSGDTPMILMAPAWRRWCRNRRCKSGTVIIHSIRDECVPFGDSLELCRGNIEVPLIATGEDHRLNDSEARSALASALCLVLADNPKPSS